ncbi:MAG TPA: hypothetical protein VGG38_11170 [Acidimicrobiales bacterium]|jgi:photosystem II stability/assembly factor-like uncharacterized protein
MFGRSVAVTGVTGALVLAFAGLLAITVGVVAVQALAPSSTTSSNGSGSGSTSGTTASTTTTTLPNTLANGPTQGAAPEYQIPGGVQPGYGNFNSVSCVSTTRCFAAGADDNQSGVTDVSTDGGKSWSNSSLPSGTPPLDAISCFDSDHCIAVGRGATVATTNGGSSWMLASLPVANTTLIGATCTSATNCLAVGVTYDQAGPFAGALLTSSNGGSSWAAAQYPTVGGLGGVVCPTSSDCISVGTSLLVSSDGGSTWATASVPGGTQALTSVSCMSTTTCVAVGANPFGQYEPTDPAIAVMTTDDGHTWSKVTLPSSTASVDRISCGTGTCVAGGSSPTTGGNALLLQSTNGSSWTGVSNASSGLSELAGLSCPATGQCAVVGRGAGRQAATAATSNLSTWATSQLPDSAVPPATDAGQ